MQSLNRNNRSKEKQDTVHCVRAQAMQLSLGERMSQLRILSTSSCSKEIFSHSPCPNHRHSTRLWGRAPTSQRTGSQPSQFIPFQRPHWGWFLGTYPINFPVRPFQICFKKPQERVLQNDEILLPNARELVRVKVKFTFGVIAPI